MLGVRLKFSARVKKREFKIISDVIFSLGISWDVGGEVEELTSIGFQCTVRHKTGDPQLFVAFYQER
jgi:hypothetical protein